MHEHQFNSKGTANSLTQRNHLLYKERDEVNLENARRNSIHSTMSTLSTIRTQLTQLGHKEHDDQNVRNENIEHNEFSRMKSVMKE